LHESNHIRREEATEPEAAVDATGEAAKKIGNRVIFFPTEFPAASTDPDLKEYREKLKTEMTKHTFGSVFTGVNQ
jgi:hypothetical protein